MEYNALDFLNPLIRLGLLLAILCVILATFTPSLNWLLQYGKTYTSASRYFNVYLPKAWFTHFYILSSILAAINLCNRPSAVTALVLLHSWRRLFECLYVSKFSPGSIIHLSHYLVGIFFYASLNLSVMSLPEMGNATGVSYLLIAGFLLLQLDQFANHYILANTKKYLHPSKHLFNVVSNPHYLDEILIYLLLNVLIYLNTGQLILNFVLMEIWVIVDLLVAGLNTWKYYKRTQPVVAKYIIIPYVY